MGCGSSRQPAEPAAAPTRDLSRRSEVVAPDVDVSIVRELTSRIANLQEQNLLLESQLTTGAEQTSAVRAADPEVAEELTRCGSIGPKLSISSTQVRLRTRALPTPNV